MRAMKTFREWSYDSDLPVWKNESILDGNIWCSTSDRGVSLEKKMINSASTVRFYSKLLSGWLPVMIPKSFSLKAASCTTWRIRRSGRLCRLLSISVHQTMCFGHLVTVEAFPTGKRPGGKSKLAGWSDYFSQLAADLTCQSNRTMTDWSFS